MAGKRETPIVKAILEALALRGIWAWRTNSGTIVGSHKGKDWVVRGAPSGTPDILLVLNGRLCGLEVKTEDGKLRASQQRWADKARKNGVGYGVARSVSEALAIVEFWRRAAA